MKKKRIAFLHVLLTLGQGLVAIGLILIDLLPLAIAVGLAGKWRVITFNIYRLARNLKSNSCDIIVILGLILSADSFKQNEYIFGISSAMLLLWLVVIKPKSSRAAIIIQSAICQWVGLSTIWLVGVDQDLPGFFAIPMAALVGYSSARHFATAFYEEDTPERRILPVAWAFVITQLAWISWVWAVTYRLPGDLFISQIALISTLLAYFAIWHIYEYPDYKRKIPKGYVWKQTLFFTMLMVAIMVLTPWLA